METIKLVISGRPTTKKNSSRVVRRGKFSKVLPSEAFERYQEAALWQLKSCRQHIDGPVWAKCLYWMPSRQSWPDLIGLLQASSDILEMAGIISNDRWIKSYDGSRIVGIDKKNPRAEIVLVPLEDGMFAGRVLEAT